MSVTLPTEQATAAALPKTKTIYDRLHFLWYLSRRSPLTLLGAGIITLVLIMIIFAPWIAPYNPDKISLTARLAPPSTAHWFGTDEV